LLLELDRLPFKDRRSDHFEMSIVGSHPRPKSLGFQLDRLGGTVELERRRLRGFCLVETAFRRSAIVRAADRLFDGPSTFGGETLRLHVFVRLARCLRATMPAVTAARAREDEDRTASIPASQAIWNSRCLFPPALFLCLRTPHNALLERLTHGKMTWETSRRKPQQVSPGTHGAWADG
jgi:hypothetical protein